MTTRLRCGPDSVAHSPARPARNVATRTFEQRAEGDVRFRIAWPDATVETRSRLSVRIGATEYEVSIELEAVELPGSDREEVIGRRRWQRTLPR